MVTEKDLIIYPYNDIRTKVAEYLANNRLFFEYPRNGYGAYDNNHIINILNGYLGEFVFLEFMLDKFKLEFKDDVKYWESVKDKYKFYYKIVIGDYDAGFEFSIKNKTIDIKNYGTKKVSINDILRLNLLIDKNQSAKADIYIQSFILNNDSICLAGYNIGLPQRSSDKFPQPAYYCPTRELRPMNGLFNDI
jgi:hypothetical protein